MKVLMAEYGSFMVAIIGVLFCFAIFYYLPRAMRSFSTEYIQYITGVSDTSYQER